MKPFVVLVFASLLFAPGCGGPVGSGTDAGVDAAITRADGSVDAGCTSAFPGHDPPASLGDCTSANEGDEVCTMLGEGFACASGCWQFFFDGPCAPRPDGGLDAGVADTGPVGDAGTCGVQPATDHLGDTCAPSSETCPAGYTCHPFEGFALTYSCEILCEPGGCPCPSGTSCNMRSDKGGSWYQCDALDG